MKKMYLPVLALMLASGIFAHSGNGGGYMGSGMCWFCSSGLDFKVSDTKDGAIVSITSGDKEKAAEIKKQAEEWVSWHNRANNSDEYTGMMMHGGGGMGVMMGYDMCPFCGPGVKLDLNNRADGVDITIHAKESRDVSHLHDTVKRWIKWHKNMTAKEMMGYGTMMHGIYTDPGDGRYGHMGMMDGNWGYFGGGIFMWGIIIIVLALLVLFIFRMAASGGRTGTESALDILKKRYAKGEITKTEYEKMKKDL